MIAGQVPAGKAGALPLNGTKVAAETPDPLALPPVPPPVRFAPLGYVGEKFRQNKSRRMRPTPIGRESSWN